MTEDNPIMEQIQRLMIAIRFDEIAREESKRTVVVRPEDADRLRWLLDQSGVGDRITLVENPWIPEGCYIVMDQQAIEAGTREAVSKMAREGWWSQ